jgi:hypothetical protein
MNPEACVPSPGLVRAAPAAAWPGPATTAADLLDRVIAAGDLDRQVSAALPWLWHGFLGPGKITLLTSQWKSGKTTLLALLLARMGQGGQLAGLPVAQGKAFVISEESAADWRLRFGQLGIGDNVHLLCRPFVAQPNMDQWLALIETAAAMYDRHGTGLVVFDSLAQFLPAHAENSAGALLECLTPLQRLTAHGMCVCLAHHPHKGKTIAGQAARGSSALPSFVDILMEMGHVTHPDNADRRRRLVAFSRYDETPRHLLIELQPDGSDYTVVQNTPEVASSKSWQGVLHVLSEAYARLTRQDILDRWPDDYDRPEASTLWRWLDRAVTLGHVRQEGSGRPNDRFRYWLPERQEMMRPENATPEQMQAWNQRYLAEITERLKLKGDPARPSEPADKDRTGEN